MLLCLLSGNLVSCVGSTSIIQSDKSNHTYIVAEDIDKPVKVFAPSEDRKSWISALVTVKRGDKLFTQEEGQTKTTK